MTSGESHSGADGGQGTIPSTRDLFCGVSYGEMDAGYLKRRRDALSLKDSLHPQSVWL